VEAWDAAAISEQTLASIAEALGFQGRVELWRLGPWSLLR